MASAVFFYEPSRLGAGGIVVLFLNHHFLPYEETDAASDCLNY